MKIKKERSGKILDLLSKNQKADVTELSEILGVSQVTVRKDLEELEAKGIIRRMHGYAELASSDDINGRLAYHYDAKKRIAAKAAELVHDGDTIMIESGSCCALLAQILSETRRNLTIVTNSAFIADYIRTSKNVNTVLLGGIYQSDSRCLVGPMVKDGASNYHVSLFFAGTDGWSEQTGFTNKDQMRAQAVRDMATSSSRMVIVTESEKFNAPGTVPMNIPHQPTAVITDTNVNESVRETLQESGIDIITAETL